jgi:hypothetical protein
MARGVSDYERPSVFSRRLAFRVTHGRGEVECQLLGMSASGPLRLEISLAKALAFADAGIHTVFLAA